MCGAGHGFMRGDAPREAADGVDGSGADDRRAVGVLGRRRAARDRRPLPASRGACAGSGRQVRRPACRDSLPAEFERFRVGLDDFLEVETAEEGLGPAFNAASCAVCHNVPAIGGVEPRVSRCAPAYRDAHGRFGRCGADGTPLDTLFHLFSTPTHGCQPVLPPEANVIARRMPIPLFGAGLVEAIADETLLALEDPDDRNGDGISGRAAIVVDLATGGPRVGRFGWKAQHATLRTFSADAYRNEMGITNELFPRRAGRRRGARSRCGVCDPIPDPEDVTDPRTAPGGDRQLRGVHAASSRRRRAARSTTRCGRRRAGVPRDRVRGVPRARARRPAPDAHPLFDRKPVPLFSDLLLHDVGTGDGIPQASAPPDEIRTPALWGLRVRRPLLHDGSASTVEERSTGTAAKPRRRHRSARAFERAARVSRLASAILQALCVGVLAASHVTLGFVNLPRRFRPGASRRRARPIVIGAPLVLSRSRTESAALSRVSTSMACPGFSALLSMKRRKAGS